MAHLIKIKLLLITALLIAANINENIVFEKAINKFSKLIVTMTSEVIDAPSAPSVPPPPGAIFIKSEKLTYTLYHLITDVNRNETKKILWVRSTGRPLDPKLRSPEVKEEIAVLDVILGTKQGYILYTDHDIILLDSFSIRETKLTASYLLDRESAAFGLFVKSGKLEIKNKILYIQILFTNGKEKLWKLEGNKITLIKGQ